MITYQLGHMTPEEEERIIPLPPYPPFNPPLHAIFSLTDAEIAEVESEISENVVLGPLAHNRAHPWPPPQSQQPPKSPSPQLNPPTGGSNVSKLETRCPYCNRKNARNSDICNGCGAPL